MDSGFDSGRGDEETVVLKDDRLLVSESLRNSSAFLRFQNDTAEVVIDGVVL